MLADTVAGTGMDLTDLGTSFGMSRWMISGLVWIAITILITMAAYGTSRKQGLVAAGGTTKTILLLFTVCVVGGTLLGLLHPLVASLLFILCGTFIGYILFFKSETLHKGVMFMVWMFLVVSFAGNFAAGGQPYVATYLTSAVSANETATINVASTNGFADSGVIVIGDEVVGYPAKTDTTFERTAIVIVTTNPLVRGMTDTEAVSHASGARVRTREASFLNAAIDYKITRITDSAGGLDFITLPLRILDLLGTFFILPFGFLGTDLAILCYIWMVVVAGMIVGLALSIMGGRRT